MSGRHRFKFYHKYQKKQKNKKKKNLKSREEDGVEFANGVDIYD